MLKAAAIVPKRKGAVYEKQRPQKMPEILSKSPEDNDKTLLRGQAATFGVTLQGLNHQVFG